MKNTYHLYWRLPWRNADVGKVGFGRYTILRSDTEKIVAYADSKKEANRICEHFEKTGVILTDFKIV